MNHRPVRVVTDSGADIPEAMSLELDITIVPLLVQMGGQSYRDGLDLTGPDFYQRLKTTGSVTTTSLPTLDSFVEAYRELTSAGYDVLSVHLSSRLSGTFNAALMASTGDGVTPEAVEVLDSRTISMAQGWIALRAAERAREGASLSEVLAYAESLVSRAHLYGALDSLDQVMRSGRLGRIPGTAANLLSIKPILTITASGEAVIQERVRTRSKALERVVALTRELGKLEALAVMHGADEEGARHLSYMLEELDPPAPVIVAHIGAVLGTHLGPYAVGVCALTQG